MEACDRQAHALAGGLDSTGLPQVVHQQFGGPDRVSLGSDRFVYPWGQTDLEFSPQEILNRSDPEAPYRAAIRRHAALPTLWLTEPG